MAPGRRWAPARLGLEGAGPALPAQTPPHSPCASCREGGRGREGGREAAGSRESRQPLCNNDEWMNRAQMCLHNCSVWQLHRLVLVQQHVQMCAKLTSSKGLNSRTRGLDECSWCEAKARLCPIKEHYVCCLGPTPKPQGTPTHLRFVPFGSTPLVASPPWVSASANCMPSMYSAPPCRPATATPTPTPVSGVQVTAPTQPGPAAAVAVVLHTGTEASSAGLNTVAMLPPACLWLQTDIGHGSRCQGPEPSHKQKQPHLHVLGANETKPHLTPQFMKKTAPARPWCRPLWPVAPPR